MTNKQSIILVTVALILLGSIIFFLLFSSLFTITTDNSLDDGEIVNIDNTTLGVPVSDPLITPVAKVYKSFIRPDDPVRGTNNSGLTILEFGDFECPYCAQIYLDLIKILDEHRGEVRLVWKDFVSPVHINGRQAALAARCAAEQNKFWEYHDYLFENQSMLSRELYNQIALELELDLATFNNCLDNQSIIEYIGQGLEDGQRLGVDATPFLFIGNTKINFALTYEELKEVVEYELNNQ